MYKFRFLWLLCLLSSSYSFLMSSQGDRLVKQEDIREFIILVQNKLEEEMSAKTLTDKPVILVDIYKLLWKHLFKPEIVKTLYREFKAKGITRNQLLTDEQVKGFIFGMLFGTLKKALEPHLGSKK